MTYSKPELLATEAALDAIRGNKGIGDFDSDLTQQQPSVAAYEVDE